MKALATMVMALSLTAAGGDAKSYPDGPDGLKELVRDLGVADDARADLLAEGLILEDPEAWFKTHFPAGDVPALADEYVAGNKPSALTAALYLRNQRGQNDLVVERFDTASDPNAAGYQDLALQAAKKPLVLYSVRAVSTAKKKTTTAWHLFNFVYVENAWKFVGPMKVLAASQRGLDLRENLRLDMALSLRLKERDAFVRKNKVPR
jgi:hypothetical protein